MSLPICRACGSEDLLIRSATCQVESHLHGKHADFIICRHCRFISNPGNHHDFREDSGFEAGTNLTSNSARVGDGETPGREFLMAEMGLNILRRKGNRASDVLVFGAGMSRDHQLIARRFPVSRVAVSDLDNFQSAPDFVAMGSREPEFDLVIASEVIEHFTDDLLEDFSNLLSKVRDGGLVIAGTHVHNGRPPLERVAYPFEVGHTSYYSGRSLQCICERRGDGTRLDFRTPAMSFRGASSRKRYIFFYRDLEVGDCIAQYFADHHVAPSE